MAAPSASSSTTYTSVPTLSFPRHPNPSPLRPSLFELLADDQLRDLLHPVFKYVLTYFTHRYPRYLLRVLNHHEEFFACLLLILERHHLKRHNASLSEHFYQLRAVPDRRIPTPRLDAIQPRARFLSRQQRWGLLFFLVGVPYIRARAQDYYERLGGGQDPDNLPPDTLTPTTLPQHMYKRLYPYVNLGVDLAFLSYDLAYLFRKTEHYRPWHRLLRIHIERDDGQHLPPPSRVWDKLPSLVPPLLLLLKLSSWWYSPISPREMGAGQGGTRKSYHHAILPPRALPILPSSGILPLTPPPSPPLSSTEISSLDRNEADVNSRVGGAVEGELQSMYRVTEKTYGECPLCAEKWQNPAVLPSGWVVCWKCGFDAVEGEEGTGMCPITGIPVGPGGLRRVLL